MTDKLRIAAFLSHPTQHHSPWFARMGARDDVDFKAFFFSDHGTVETLDREFGAKFKWDIPMLNGFESEFLPSIPGMTASYLGQARTNRGVMDALGQKDWDVVFNPAYNLPTNWIVWAAAQAKSIPLVFHSDSTLKQPRNIFERGFKELPVRLFYSRIDHFLASGDNNIEYLKRYGVDERKVSMCPIPVDGDRFKNEMTSPDWDSKRAEVREKLGLKPEDKVVAFCGKLVKRKRPMDLVRALEKCKTANVKALYIGTGPLESRVRESGGDKAVITGFINQKDIPCHLGIADILAMPSEYDAHPIVITEAAFMGIPSIISDQCGCYGPNDILRHGENGFVYPCGDTSGMAEFIDRLLSEEGLRERMSRRGMELAETQDTRAAEEALAAAARRVGRKRA